MPKICNTSECSNPVFGGGYCKWHQGYRKDKKPSNAKHRKPIAPISKKRSQELVGYKKARNKYMANHSTCEVSECNRPANDLHHKRGRIGSLLWDPKFFMAVCRPHHNEIEENPEWAYKNNYSVKRIGK